MTLSTKAVRRLHPATLIISFLRSVPEAVFALPAIVGMVSSARIGTLLLLAAAGALVAAGLAVLTWFRFSYGIAADHIVIESGVLARRRRSIPFDRIQDVTIERPLLARLFGVAVLKLETGSAGKDEGELNAISLGEAQRLRDGIRAAAAAEVTGRVEQDAAHEDRTIFAMHLPRLFLAGMFSFSLLLLALIAGLVEFAAPLMNFDFLDHHRWMGRIGAVADHLSMSTTIGIAAAVLFLGVLGGVAQTITRDYRFRLLKTDVGFRRRRGLFTLSEAAFAAARVQTAVIVTGPVRRFLGWFRLELQTLGSEGKKGGHHVAAPLARLAEITEILNELKLPGIVASSGYMRVSRRFVLHRSIRYTAILTLTAWLVAIWWPWAFASLALLPVCFLFAELQWRHHSYCFTNDAVHIRYGVLKQRLWVIPLTKVQAVSVTRSFVQRPWSLATLLIDTAGASLLTNARVTDINASDAERFARHLLSASEIRSKRC